MAGRYERLGGSGPQGESSGNSDTEAGLARLAALGDIAKSDLPLGQGEEGARQGAPAPTAAELRASLREIAETHESTAPAAPPTPGDIRAALHGRIEALKQPAQIAEENKKKEQKKALKRVAETLRVAPDVLSIVTCKLENLVVQEGISTGTATSLRSVLVLLESINPRDLEVAQQEVEKAINVMDTKESSHQ